MPVGGGEQHVGAGAAAMVVNIGPILIALLGGWLLGVRGPARVIFVVVTGFGHAG